ncbi:MAG TPA: three-Cys-motif partner protein TcmP [Candidatus Dormibacteraeota bacterium]|nr:three-Cys-motif partner protein TcmP [Candidatus Dormibacteraeota bacterium]
MRSTKSQFEAIGYWSEIKLEILKKYADAYSRIFSAKKQHLFFHVYIDAFAGAGKHLSKKSHDLVPGSPLNALAVQPEFREYHLIDIAPEKIETLQHLVGSRSNVFIYRGDCNEILLRDVFPRVRYDQYRRGLCVLDPYGLHLDWKVISTAGSMKTLDLFLNFPVQDINRNAIWRNPERVKPEQIERMNRFWGDESWKKVAYGTSPGLFGPIVEKEPNEVITTAFRRRLKDVAGFSAVPEPLPMQNSKGAVVYYLYFASQNDKAGRIAREIFSKYERNRRQ